MIKIPFTSKKGIDLTKMKFLEVKLKKNMEPEIEAVSL